MLQKKYMCREKFETFLSDTHEIKKCFIKTCNKQHCVGHNNTEQLKTIKYIKITITVNMRHTNEWWSQHTI